MEYVLTASGIDALSIVGYQFSLSVDAFRNRKAKEAGTPGAHGIGGIIGGPAAHVWLIVAGYV